MAIVDPNDPGAISKAFSHAYEQELQMQRSQRGMLDIQFNDLVQQIQSRAQPKPEPLLEEIVEVQREQIVKYEEAQQALEAQNKELKETVASLQKVLLEQAKAINALLEKSA